RLQQPIDPAAHRPLRQPRLLGQGDVALPGVVLQLSDDEAVDVVEAITHLLSLSGCGAANQPAPVASQRAEVLRIWRMFLRSSSRDTSERRSPSNITMSASFPGSRLPRVAWAPRASADTRVAATTASIGLRPASTRSATSRAERIP